MGQAVIKIIQFLCDYFGAKRPGNKKQPPSLLQTKLAEHQLLGAQSRKCAIIITSVPISWQMVVLGLGSPT